LNISSPPLNAFILAGGQSSRMGRNKAMAPVAGIPLIGHAIRIALAMTPDIFIVGPRESCQNWGFPIIPDEVKSRGPISGVLTALKNSSSSLNLILACDMPQVPTEFLCLLLEKVGSAPAAIFRHPDGRAEPLCGIYSRQILPEVEHAYHSGDFSLHILLGRIPVRWVEAGELPDHLHPNQIFRNVNSPVDLHQLRKEKGRNFSHPSAPYE
jgi:molybdopterin-guanine dinucleotide biosynthesis protein A